MANHAQTRLLNAELRETAKSFAPQAVAQRASDRVYRVTGYRIPSSAVFAAMGIRQETGESSRGQWLTGRAMSESVSTDRRTADERRTDAQQARRERDARNAEPSVARTRSLATRIERETAGMCHALAQWSVWDEAHFATLFDLIAADYAVTDDQADLSESLRVLQLMREASREWENDLLTQVRTGAITSARLRKLVELRRKSDVVNGRKAPTVADCPFWDARTPHEPKVVAAVPRAVFTHAAPVADAATEIMHDNKFFTRGTE
jgi:hypothetical protein